MLKCSSKRSVCAPQGLSAGTSPPPQLAVGFVIRAWSHPPKGFVPVISYASLAAVLAPADHRSRRCASPSNAIAQQIERETRYHLDRFACGRGREQQQRTAGDFELIPRLES